MTMKFVKTTCVWTGMLFNTETTDATVTLCGNRKYIDPLDRSNKMNFLYCCTYIKEKLNF